MFVSQEESLTLYRGIVHHSHTSRPKNFAKRNTLAYFDVSDEEKKGL
jgi:hypothetical protein